MKIRSLILFLSLITYSHLSAQLSDEQHQKIDSLFIDWNQPNHPGGTVGIMQDGKIVFSKAYGLASLEYLVPNSPETMFNIASVSKQFTAMGIVILHLDGKLSVDDDIRKHLPELPDFGETVTIRHMLHHTSGLRSLHAMLALAGWRGDDSRTNEDLFRFVKNQKDLNFKPGAEYLYCNTGYMLMVNIIEKVTGEKFPEWLKKTVFEPMGMINTYVEDNYSNIVPHNATSYYSNGQDNGFNRAVEYWGYVGSGNVHSTATDLLKWMNNFSHPKLGWKSRFELLKTTDNLNGGQENNYAFGISFNDYFGNESIGHNGAIGGFRSTALTFPEEKLSIVILTNFPGSSVGQKSYQISEILLDNKVDVSDTSNGTFQAKNTISMSTQELKKFEKSYWNDKDNYTRKIYLKQDTLRYFRSENNESPLVPIGANEFQILDVDDTLIAKFDIQESSSTMTVTIDDDETIVFNSYDPSEADNEEISEYIGKYYSPELETTYSIIMEGDELYWHHPRHGNSQMTRIKTDVLQGGWPMNMVKIKRNGEGSVEGILVSNGRVKNLWMEKQSK